MEQICALVKDKLTALQGEILANKSLTAMAILAIFVGSVNSILINAMREFFIAKPGLALPLIPLLATLYLPEEDRSLMLTTYLCVSGVCKLVRQLKLFTSFFLQDGKNVLINDIFHIYYDDILVVGFSLAIGAWYLLEKHWIACNILTFAIVVDLIAALQVNDVISGGILLGSLFFGDVLLHVTSLKITFITSLLESKFQLVFPKDLFAANHDVSDFVTLNVVEIVIPGILMAFLLRFDYSKMRLSCSYFFIALVAYTCILPYTFMDDTFFFNIPLVLMPPTSLFIIPLLCLAFVNGDLKELLTYRD